LLPPGRQLRQYRLFLGGAETGPARNFVQLAKTADTMMALGINQANIDAG